VNIFVPTAWEVVRSALVAGGVAVLAIVSTDVTKIVNVDFVGGLAIAVAVVLIKLAQKTLDGLKRKNQADGL